MAMFTQSIREIIQQNAHGQDISTIDGIYAVGAPIFFGDEMNFISQEYRERLEKGFLIKYFNDELGYETFPLWRIAFQEKIFNNADYINLIYETLDKQIFSDYKVSRKQSTGTSSLVTDVEGQSTNVTDGTVETTNSGTTSETTSNTNVVDEDTTDTGRNTVTGTGTVANAKTGTETTADTGTDTTLHTGTKTTTNDLTNTEKQEGSYSDGAEYNSTYTDKKTGTETKVTDKDTSDRKTGTDTTGINGTVTLTKGGTVTQTPDLTSELTKAGKEENEKSGIDQRDITLAKSGTETLHDEHDLFNYQLGSYTDTNSNTTMTDNTKKDNAFQVNYNTPQGSLQNMRSPGASAAGKGVEMITGETFNYMSAAAESGNTHIDKDREEVRGKNTRTYNDYAQHDDGYIDHVTSFNDRRDKTDDDITYGSKDTLSFTARKDTTKNTGTDTTTYDTTDTTTDITSTTVTYNTTVAGTENVTDTTTFNTTDTNAKTGTDTTTRTYNDFIKTGTQTGTTEDEYDESTANTKNLQSQTTHNTTDTETRNTTDTTQSSSSGTRDITTTDNGSRSTTDSSTSTTDNDTTVTNSNTSNTEQTGRTTDNTEQIDYTYNMELIYRSIPLLSKVWEIFDDLFMFIYS